MSSSSFDEALKYVLSDEGGNDDDPVDRGGRTSRGITKHDWDLWRQHHPERNLPADVWMAPRDEVHALYRDWYWNGPHPNGWWSKCDQLPTGLDYVVFDYGVMSGNRGPKVLQGFVGVLADGKIGQETIGKVDRANPPSLINQICDEKAVFYQAIVRSRPEQVRFLDGWKSRNTRARSRALQMWKDRPLAPLPTPATKTPGFWAFLKGLFNS